LLSLAVSAVSVSQFICIDGDLGRVVLVCYRAISAEFWRTIPFSFARIFGRGEFLVIFLCRIGIWRVLHDVESNMLPTLSVSLSVFGVFTATFHEVLFE
jgi:hypothetical protein